MFRKTLLVVLLLLIATNLWAAYVPGPLDVSKGVHNLGSTGTYASKSLSEDEVCIFCHTPHGGTASTPLWNRDLPDQAGLNEFRHYSSTTLSGYLKTAGMDVRAVSTESLLCMSCHDGTVALNSINNASNRTVGGLPDVLTDPMTDTSFGWGVSVVIGDPTDLPNLDGIAAGRNLTDDHPISFSYTASQAHADNTGQLKLVADAKDAGIRFFGAQDRVECSSCHDPHIDYSTVAGKPYTPFLRTNNYGSALCLACHIK